MLTHSRYTLSGSPQRCAFCRQAFPLVEERREAFRCGKTGAYFCDSDCAWCYRETASDGAELKAA